MLGTSIPPPEALLVDMDGVLAEVSQSYRAAIVATAAAFGVTITMDDISAAKAEGNANNDWVLSQRLIAQNGGGAVEFEAVKAKFEELYQGTGGAPGLKSLESLLTSKGLLEELERRLPRGMAIVTGRPIRDCTEFLETHGIAHLFRACVCMEDTELPKPSPQPCLLALEKLGYTSPEASSFLGVDGGPCVAMLGDTVDDIVAAIGANVHGIAVQLPGRSLEGTDAFLRGEKGASLTIRCGTYFVSKVTGFFTFFTSNVMVLQFFVFQASSTSLTSSCRAVQRRATLEGAARAQWSA